MPFDLRPKNPGDRIIKVNHAGEHGAISIYSGQILVSRLTAPKLCVELREFRAHEQGHRAIFSAELQRRGLSRCRSYWLCGIGGYALGVITALFGSNAIAATTVAVESVVLRHLNLQLQHLQDLDAEAVTAISTIIDEERMHHDLSASHLFASRFWPRLIMPVVALSTETVIWIGMNI
ncbi:demethoxyubiquinone hydroxylase family protein [Undibacterium sp. TJN25]|uniref:demethoxyubiquinone hydroxylase family protein n=1 Tax=Undibacterium sp. TJN25 TaxID=3413056 RepID=UPI003BF300EB